MDNNFVRNVASEISAKLKCLSQVLKNNCNNSVY